MILSGLPNVVWLTRDRFHGVLSDLVEVWSVRPIGHTSEDGDRMWMAPDNVRDVADLQVRLGDVSHATAVAYFGPGVPDDERQCTRVGQEDPA